MSKYVFVGFVLIVMLPALVMSDVSQWAKVIEASSLVSVDETLEGDYVAAGSKEFEASRSKALVVRFDSLGNIRSAKSYQLTNEDSVSMILATADGGFVLTGNTRSNRGDAFLMKVDGNGKILSQKLYGTTTSQEDSKSIIQASDGGFFLLGHSETDIWCMKLNSEMEISWIKIYGRDYPYKEVVSAAAGTRDGGLIFAGVDHYDNAPIVVKLNSNGNVIWEKRLMEGLGYFLQTNSMTQTADGGYILGGELSIAFYGTVGWAAKLDSFGNLIWRKGFNYGASGVTAVREENDRHILVMGFVWVEPQRTEIFTVRLNSEGIPFSRHTFGESRTPLEERVLAIHDTPDDGTVFVGSRERIWWKDSVIGRTSSEGDICNALQKPINVSIYNLGWNLRSTFVRVREGTFDVFKANFRETTISTKTIDLCN